MTPEPRAIPRSKALVMSQIPFDVDVVEVIKNFQREANEIGIPLKVDGKAGVNTRRWVEGFQRGYAGGRDGGELLVVDGILGPKTIAAHSLCAASGGWTGKWFTFVEFRTKNPNRVLNGNNPIIMLDRDLVLVLDRLRDRVGAITVISGFRDTVWNRIVGGATNSQHRFGKACDMNATLGVSADMAARAGAYGIGTTMTRQVVHVDVRESLARWEYRARGTVGIPVEQSVRNASRAFEMEGSAA